MAATYSCDGCGNPIDKPIVLGKIVKRDYCETCAEAAATFTMAEEALRAAAHEKFIADRALLIERFSANGFKLPDAQAGSAPQPRQAGVDGPP